MAWTVADGVPGLEGIHTWNGGAAVLNDRAGGLPYVKLTEIDGLYGLPEADDPREPRTGRQGEATRPGLPRGKTSVYIGLVIATDPRELRAYTGELRAAFAERSFEHAMRITPPAFASGGPTWLFNAKVLGCDIPERQDVGIGALPSPWQRAITLTLRLSDGRFVVDADAIDDGPFASASTQTIHHDGSADTEPVITGAVTLGDDVLLENLSVPVGTGGGHAFLRFLSVPNTGALTVDFAARSAYITAGGVTYDLVPFADPASNWWDEGVYGLLAGDNGVKVTGASNWHVSRSTRSW
jgi:hypothetical protein